MENGIGFKTDNRLKAGLEEIDGFFQGDVLEVDARDDDLFEFFFDGCRACGLLRGIDGFAEVGAGETEGVFDGEVGTAEGLSENGAGEFGIGSFDFPAVVEVGGDGGAGVGKGLGEQGFFSGVEIIPGEGGEVAGEVALEEEVVDEGGFGFFGEHGADVGVEERAVAAGEEEVEFVAGVALEEVEFVVLWQVGPFGDEDEVAQAVVGDDAVEELVGVGEGCEGAPIGIEEVFDGDGLVFGEDGGAVGGDMGDGGILMSVPADWWTALAGWVSRFSGW